MRLLTAALLVIFISCNSGSRLPPDVLPAEKMQVVLWDILQADELAAYKASVDTGFNNLRFSVRMYKGIFDLHKITEQQFRTSFRYYEMHPRLFKPIMDSLQRRADRVATAPAVN